MVLLPASPVIVSSYRLPITFSMLISELVDRSTGEPPVGTSSYFCADPAARLTTTGPALVA